MAQDLQAHKVTKPIQLLAAWLIGLIVIDGAFLTAANLLSAPAWGAALLVIAAVLNVPVFLVCIFLLQTRFRPEMQEDSYYSKYLEVQQQTLKVSTSEDQIATLRDMLVSSQTRVSEALVALDSGVGEIRSRLPKLSAGSNKIDIQAALNSSERVLEETRSRLLPGVIKVEVNDLLPRYREILKKWSNTRIVVKSTFGSTSEEYTSPVYSVISFGAGVDGDAMSEVCRSLKDSGEWYVDYHSANISAGRIYVGAYGYGGEDVALLTDELLAEMARPGFSTTMLQQWLARNAIHLNADYPMESKD